MTFSYTAVAYRFFVYCFMIGLFTSILSKTEDPTIPASYITCAKEKYEELKQRRKVLMERFIRSAIGMFFFGASALGCSYVIAADKVQSEGINQLLAFGTMGSGAAGILSMLVLYVTAVQLRINNDNIAKLGLATIEHL